MRHLLHSVICGLTAALVVVSGARADAQDTVTLLRTMYESAVAAELGETIRHSSVVLPHCSGVTEVILTLRMAGPEWVNFFFPDAGGDPAGIDAGMAANFCVYTLGLHDQMETPCPYNPQGSCEQYTISGDPGLDAALGCMVFLMDFSDGSMGGAAAEINSEVLYYGPDMDWDSVLGVASSFYCDGQDVGDSDFWSSFHQYPTQCSTAMQYDCQQVDTVMHVMSRMGSDNGFNDYDRVFSMDMYELAENLSNAICLYNGNLFYNMFGSGAVCDQIVRGIVGRYWSCWQNNFDSGMLQELYERCRYGDDEAGGMLETNCAINIIKGVLNYCQNSTPYCTEVCWGYDPECQENQWGDFVCNPCPQDQASTANKSFIDECITQTNSGTGSNNSGEFYDAEVICPLDIVTVIE